MNKVDTGKNFSCALTTAGGVKCWGINNLRQLGDGTTTNRSSPVDVSGLTSGVSDISVGYSHSCAIVADGKLKCWGSNTSSQLGDGTTATYTTPIDAVAVSTEYVVTVGAGNAHTCVKTSSDNMLCWGSNSSGKLGDGTSTQRATPVAVSGLGRVATIAVGDSHTCATTTDGAAKCWGYNGGRLGDGLATSSSTPRAVLGLDSGVIQLSAGEINTCAITSGGGLKCWGGNTYGAVGASPPTLTTVKSSRRFSGTARLNGMPIDGVTMSITGMGTYYPQTSINTDADGAYGLYTCEGVPFVLTPSKTGYQFTPNQLTGNASSDFTQDFIATAIPYNITGTVTATGTPLAGVSIDGGALGTQITDGGGAYSFTGVGFGTSYTLTPSLANYEFTPADSSGTVSGDVVHDFAAVYNPSVTTTTSVVVTTTTVQATTTEPTTTAETTSVATTTFESSSTIVPLTTTVATTSTVAPSTTVATTTIPADVTDSDNDGIADSEELSAGTNPNDPGSKAPKLRTKLCSDWNGYLGGTNGRGMYNIVEHINLTDKKIRVKTELRSIRGHLKDTYEFFLRGNQQFDLLVHDMAGRELNSYGQVCSTYERAPAGGVDGRMVYYKYGDAGDMQFAFALPFEDPLRGTSGLLFNTKQPSLDPQDSSNLVANWVQLSNVSKKRLKGTLTFYSLEGTALGSYSVDLRDGARYDYPGHAWGSQAGLARFVPENSTVDYQLRAVRYLYDNADGRDSFTTAYPFGAAVGSGETLIAPVDTSSTSSAAVLTDLQSNSAILELSNTLNKKVAVALNLYDNTGKKLLYSKTHSLKAYSALHLPLDTLLLNSTGLLTAKSSHSGSIIGSVVHYGRVASGGLINLYAVPLREPVGTVFKGSYNTYLNQGCSLYLGNSATSKEKVTVTLRQNDGTSPVSSYSLTVPGRGLLTDNVCAKSQNDTYGVVTVTATKSKRITGLLLRVGERGRYKIATEMR